MGIEYQEALTILKCIEAEFNGHSRRTFYKDKVKELQPQLQASMQQLLTPSSGPRLRNPVKRRMQRGENDLSSSDLKFKKKISKVKSDLKGQAVKSNR